MNTRLRELCSGVRMILTHYDFLSEDLFGFFGVREGFLKRLRRESWVLESYKADRLLDERPVVYEHRRYAVELRQKAAWVSEAVAARPTEKGVVFTRTIRLGLALIERFEASKADVAFVHGELSGDDRRDAMEKFTRGDTNILVITRDTGKRGLDLPMADYGVFYSPKSRETTVWQELSRIRSNVTKTKDSFFLLYAGTPDENKCAKLFDDMMASGRDYDIR